MLISTYEKESTGSECRNLHIKQEKLSTYGWAKMSYKPRERKRNISENCEMAQSKTKFRAEQVQP